MKRGREGREGEGSEGEGRGVKMLHTYIQTDIQTDIHTDIHTEPPTKRVLEEHSLLKIGTKQRNRSS